MEDRILRCGLAARFVVGSFAGGDRHTRVCTRSLLPSLTPSLTPSLSLSLSVRAPAGERSARNAQVCGVQS